MLNASRQHSKVLYHWGGKKGKTGKVEMKRKWWILSSNLPIPHKETRQSPKVETTGIDQPMRKITQGAGIVKGLEDKRD